MRGIQIAAILIVLTFAAIAVYASPLKTEKSTKCLETDLANITIKLAHVTPVTTINCSRNNVKTTSVVKRATVTQALYDTCIDKPDETRMPHESDCTLYYICRNGEKIQEKCKKGYKFNKKILTCDFSENAKCDDSKQPTDPPTERPETTDPPTERPEPTDPPTEAPKPKNKCLNKPDETRLPHESNCTLYYKCEHGQQLLYRCQKGLHFDAERQICDLPGNANCEPKKPSTTTSTKPPPKPEDKCFDKPDDTRLPHETSCTLYYRCKDGQSHLYRCANDLHFNAELQQCDKPENANCNIKAPPTEAPLPPVCPDPKTIDMIPDETDCRYYYICVFGEPIRKKCWFDHLFDPITKTCDVPEKVSCKKYSDNFKVEETSNMCIGTCPLQDPSSNSILFPNKNCRKFCTCDNGLMNVYVCPDNLHFDSIQKICVHPDTAICAIDASNQNDFTIDRKDEEKKENESLEPLNEDTDNKHKIRNSFWSKLPFFGSYF